MNVGIVVVAIIVARSKAIAIGVLVLIHTAITVVVYPSTVVENTVNRNLVDFSVTVVVPSVALLLRIRMYLLILVVAVVAVNEIGGVAVSITVVVVTAKAVVVNPVVGDFFSLRVNGRVSVVTVLTVVDVINEFPTGGRSRIWIAVPVPIAIEIPGRRIRSGLVSGTIAVVVAAIADLVGIRIDRRVSIVTVVTLCVEAIAIRIDSIRLTLARIHDNQQTYGEHAHSIAVWTLPETIAIFSLSTSVADWSQGRVQGKRSVSLFKGVETRVADLGDSGERTGQPLAGQARRPPGASALRTCLPSVGTSAPG